MLTSIPSCLKESVPALAGQYPDLRVSTAGVYPNDAKDFVENDLERRGTQNYVPLDSQWGSRCKLIFCITLPVNEHSIRHIKWREYEMAEFDIRSFVGERCVGVC